MSVGLGDNIALLVAITFIFGLLFLIQEVYHEKFKLDYSLVGGISITYFFLVMLPEVINGLPDFPSHLEDFKYLYVLVGFVSIHILDKLILQKVEKANQKKIREYLKQNKQLELVEDQISTMMDREINRKNFDKDALREVSKTHKSLMKTKKEMRDDIIDLEEKIIFHVKKDLDELRDIIEFVYHFLVGIILLYFMIYHLISGLLFFMVAFLMAIITGSPIRYDHQIFSDLEIIPEVYEDLNLAHKSLKRKLILGVSTMLGIIIGLIFELIHEINLEAVYIIFSILAGILLYIIIHETLPEKEKGKPLNFFLGFLFFMLFIYSLRWLEFRF